MKYLFTFSFFLIYLNTFSQQKIYITIGGVPNYGLYSINIYNCTRTFIGSPSYEFLDIACTPDGQLWGIYNNLIYQIDTSNANITYIGNTGLTNSRSLVALNDSILLTESLGILYGINNMNAATHPIGNIGFFADGDLTWYDNDLYMTTPLVKITLNNTNTAITSVTQISNAVPYCYGAATAAFPGNINYIVGFHNGDVIKICPFNGSNQMLCSSLNLPWVNGAASVRLATQAPLPTSCNVVLPVELISFNVEKTDKGVICHWETASETNNSFFDVEKSINGKEFLKIGSVSGFGAGVSSEYHSYEFDDDNLCESIVYYRLKQVDIDGAFTYSKIVVLDCNQQNKEINFSPNPVYSSINYSFYYPRVGELFLRIIDLFGSVVQSEMIHVIKGENQKNLNVSDLNVGMYVLQISETKSGEVFRSKFLKVSK